MKSFIGKYRVFLQTDYRGRPTKNEHDTYLLHKTGHIFRYDEDTLAIYFTSTNAKNKFIPLLKQENVDVINFTEGEFESTWHFPSSQLEKVAKILKPQKKFKDTYPNFEDKNVHSSK